MIYFVDNIRFSYRPSLPVVLNGVSLTLEEGDVLTIMGRNGAGKSTLMKCMLGLLKPQQGEVCLCGEKVSLLKPRFIASQVGYVPQNHVPAFGYTVFDYVLMGCASKIGMMSHPGRQEKKDTEKALEMLDISHLKTRKYNELSGGERQQAMISRAIVGKPKAVLFDEPTAHLDVGNQVKVLRIIKSLSETGFAVAITAHDPNHALLLGGKVAIFDREGGVVCGNVEEMVTEEKLRALYGEKLMLRYLEELGRRVCISPNLKSMKSMRLPDDPSATII